MFSHWADTVVAGVAMWPNANDANVKRAMYAESKSNDLWTCNLNLRTSKSYYKTSSPLEASTASARKLS